MLSLEEAVERSLATATFQGSETVSLGNATGRFTAATVNAKVSLPSFDNSAMDGYAVRIRDLYGASPESPAELKCVGIIPAGNHPNQSIEAGTCIRLFTGSPIPTNADAVIMQEDCSNDPNDDRNIRFSKPIKPWKNIRFKGEDIRENDRVVTTGKRLTTGTIGLLAATGHGSIEVGIRPKVGLVATGSELVETTNELQAGEIYESNRSMLCSLVTKANGIPNVYPIVPDSLEATTAAMKKAFAENDVVLTSGGVSVGDHDHVKPAIGRLGGSLNFWKIAVKPGKPFVLGQVDGKSVFGLPGNPVSALVTYLLLVRPVLLKMQGASDLRLTKRIGRLEEKLVNRGDRRHFIRVTLDMDGIVKSAGGQRSHMLSSLAMANGLVDLPQNSSLAKGDLVEVLLVEC